MQELTIRQHQEAYRTAQLHEASMETECQAMANWAHTTSDQMINANEDAGAARQRREQAEERLLAAHAKEVDQASAECATADRHFRSAWQVRNSARDRVDYQRLALAEAMRELEISRAVLTEASHDKDERDGVYRVASKAAALVVK